MQHTIFQNIKQKLQEGKSVEQILHTPGQDYIRRWVPKERLILLGGGHIAQPLCRIGAMLDFSVTVVDDRPDFANRFRFMEAEQVICGEFGQVIDRLHPGAEDFVCVITRGHRFDAVCLRHLLSGEETKYLGMIGSKRRVAGLMELLHQEGYARTRLDRICAPIGFPIHAQTTAEIAVSIAAQLVEYRRRDVGNSRLQGEENRQAQYLPQMNVDLDLLDALAEPKEPQVLAVVIATKGSTPVKAGAMMTVGRLGRIAGTIGGGCGEAEVIQTARKMAGRENAEKDEDQTVNNKVISVSMTNDAAAEEGMACGGMMEVLLETIW